MSFLPTDVRASAVRTNGEWMWPYGQAGAAIDALADAGMVILGLDLRSDGTALATEYWLSSFEPEGRPTAVEEGRVDAVAALDLPWVAELVEGGYTRVLITWTDRP